jgi:LppX/LprAFG-like lipoprotein
MADKWIAIRRSPARLSRAGGRQGLGTPLLNPAKLVSVTSRAVGLSAAALVLVTACASGSSGSAGSNGSASPRLTPQQAMLAAAAQARKITSATETLTVQDSGNRNATTTGTIQVQRTPTLQLSGNLNVTGAGKSTQIKMILTSTAIYLSEPSLAKQIGKPWLKLHLAALNQTPLASIAQLVHSLQSNNFANQTQLFAATKNVRVVGKQTVDGVPTTEYAGSLHAAETLKALSPAFRKALAPALQGLGNRPMTFHIWVDGQHHTRKLTEVVTINGETINTTVNITAINQPVQITPPPASQTFTPPGG